MVLLFAAAEFLIWLVDRNGKKAGTPFGVPADAFGKDQSSHRPAVMMAME